jgi:hypothetical protein
MRTAQQHFIPGAKIDGRCKPHYEYFAGKLIDLDCAAILDDSRRKILNGIYDDAAGKQLDRCLELVDETVKKFTLPQFAKWTGYEALLALKRILEDREKFAINHTHAK